MFTHEQLHSAQGHRLTRSLFKETCKPGDVPIMTLSRNPKDNLVSLQPIYIERTTLDPTEYEFAEFVFGSYAHWKIIADATWMQPYIEEWRMEADVRRKSIAFQGVVAEVQGAGRSSFSAAKFLIEEPWKDKRRPAVKEASTKTSKKASEGVQEDILRLRKHIKKTG